MQPPRPFTTDGCSGGMSWLWRAVAGRDPPWEGACVMHDAHYWNGGTSIRRKDVDEQLRLCVAGLGYPRIARVMYWSVRLGGHPLLPLPWRWGYGWPWPRGYGED